MRMGKPIHILLIEKNPEDQTLFEAELKKSGIEYVLRIGENQEEIQRILVEYLPEIIVLDFLSLHPSANDAVSIVKLLAPATPLIVYSDRLDEEIVVDSIKAGAMDYIFKQHPARLGPALRNAIDRAKVELELAQSRERFNTLAKVSTVGIFLTASDGFCLYVNDTWTVIAGLNPEQALGEGFLTTIHPHDKKRVQAEWSKSVQQGKSFKSEYRIQHPDGKELWVLSQALPEIFESGEVAGYVGTITDITDRMNSEIQIDQSRKQLRALSVRLQTVREEERTNISREIHDDLGQALTGMRMDLVWLIRQLNSTDGKIRDRLTSLMALTDSTIHKVRKIATDLRPGILDDLGLAAAIEWQSKDITDRTGIQCNFQSLLDDLELDGKLSTAFFRIFQESITNVLRHAQAKKIDINLRREGNAILLTVQDDGKGISQHEINNPRSVGFLGMRERAAVFNGEVTVFGTPHQGTIVRVKIPLTTEQI
jgi:two-component system, NarL family, sensor histidine kinase UhpB